MNPNSETRPRVGKLRLEKDTLRRLDRNDLDQVQGGGAKPYTTSVHCALSWISLCLDQCATIL